MSGKSFGKTIRRLTDHYTKPPQRNRKKRNGQNDRMILEIKRLLTHTDMGISEIAYHLNFADQSYFSKYFKKLTNQTPLSFRNHIATT
jgi:AraC-like DNA-binding protein